MAVQTQQGKAFEYACLKALYHDLSDMQEMVIEDSDALETARRFYKELDTVAIHKMDKGARAAVKIVKRLEPLLENPDDNTPLYLAIQEDAKGKSGDVRDIVCIRKQNGWEIGFSCKHNHTAVKHSRLSQTIDFGKQWFGKACSQAYFVEISPVFQRLLMYRIALKKWEGLTDKENIAYVPILSAFMKELKRLDKKYPEVIPGELVQYLLGRNDFYKIITDESRNITTIQAYNLFGTLNQASKKVKPIQKVHQLLLPTKFYDISYKKGSRTTIIVTCDGGWSFSFRIHNASKAVEPSLKFDIQLTGIPPQLHTQVEPWKN
ncbi:HaeIII family restriction endonuclease [Lachnospiraceae bacterium ZAX-1]